MAARADGRIISAVAAAGRVVRGRRAFDLLIAATALAAGLPLYTRNPDDFTSWPGCSNRGGGREMTSFNR